MKRWVPFSGRISLLVRSIVALRPQAFHGQLAVSGGGEKLVLGVEEKLPVSVWKEPGLSNTLVILGGEE